MPPCHLVGEKQDAARHQQGAGDENGVASQGLHLVLNGQYQKQGQGAHNNQQHHPPGLRRVAPVGPAGEQVDEKAEKLQNHLPDVLPVDHAHRQQGGEVEQDVKQLVWFGHSEKMLKQSQVARAGDGQKFGHALDEAQDGGHEVGQDNVPPKGAKSP